LLGAEVEGGLARGLLYWYRVRWYSRLPYSSSLMVETFLLVMNVVSIERTVLPVVGYSATTVLLNRYHASIPVLWYDNWVD